MAERRVLWERTVPIPDTHRNPDANISAITRLHTSAIIIKDLEKAHISELKKSWETTLLTKYMENDRIPRGLCILILPSLGDMDPDLLEEWRTLTAVCSRKLMGTLITQAKRRMASQMNSIEILFKELEGISNQQEVSALLEKMEEHIKKKEDEIKIRKAHKFHRDKLDYEHSRIYTFACKHDTLRIKDKMDIRENVNLQLKDVSSDPSSSADEAPLNKLDFQGEIRMMQMAMVHPSKSRGRGGTRRGGGRGKSNKHQD
ncbi:hypothetical protein NDU88_001500 [Pleurodeles waltl]|uniref:Uncharacterized protein n=1 Tax=Pleurodeles waltl TaxID=8319 RepID=A0AAV7LB61_PLEWA|nr:hypothetical protein NDU88_001500 [Pleurodeles waltl]